MATIDYSTEAFSDSLLEQRLAAQRPTLGICLGAQLMARALGAAVYPGHQPELGWAPLMLSEAGRRSPLRHIGDTQIPVLHWHGDTFNLPDSATRLAASSLYTNQAFAWGAHALALQCHLEVTANGLERWWRGHANQLRDTPGVNVAHLRQDTQRCAPRLAQHALRVWQEWLLAQV
jgi:GMP synthase (glutamine-hydrolysing)